MLITAVISQPDVHWIKFGGTCFDGRLDNSLELQHFLKRASTVEKEAEVAKGSESPKYLTFNG